MIDAHTEKAPDDRQPELIFWQRPRCPDCHGTRLLTYKTTKGGDGSKTRRCRCADCGRRVHVIIE